MEWMTQARLHVLWSYTESRQLTGKDSDIVLKSGNYTDNKTTF